MPLNKTGPFSPILAILIANALPVYAAAVGQLTFFQVIYLYWLESLLLIVFTAVKIGFAQGVVLVDRSLLMRAGGRPNQVDERPYDAWSKLGMILRHAIGRSFVLGFYLIFLILFIMLQVTGEDQLVNMALTLGFRNSWFNAGLLAFIISMSVQLITGYFLNGQYRIASPRSYGMLLDGRIILIHVMTVAVVFLHKFLFDGKAYAAKGEILYVALLMLIKCCADVAAYRDTTRKGDTPEQSPYI